MKSSGYGTDVEHRYEDGKPITVRVSADGRNELRAPGHLTKEQMDREAGTDHVHIWEASSGVYGMHDMRQDKRLYPEMPDAERTRAAAEKDRLIAEARSILTGSIDRSAIERTKALQEAFKNLRGPEKRDEFRAVVDAIFTARKAEWNQNKQAKERVVSRAETLAYSSDFKSAADEMKRLQEEWKRIGPCEKQDSDRLWDRFSAAKDQLFARRKNQWDENRRAKERIVSQAQSCSNSSDLKSATETMKRLQDEWKKTGPCEKADADRLWQQFSSAKSRLYERKQQQHDQRMRDQASNRAVKERLVSQMRSLVSTNDYRAAKDQAKTLMGQWKQVGPCDRADNERLWQAFRSAQDDLYQAAAREAEQRRREASQRNQDRIFRLQQQLANVEAAIVRAEASYSRALSAPSPSWNNPRRWEIVDRQNARKSAADAKLSSLRMRRSDIVDKLIEAKARLNRF